VFYSGNALPSFLNMTELMISDLERARLESPGESDANLVVRLAQRAVAELGMKPPISHVLMASMRGVRRIEEAHLPCAGCLILDNGVLVIRLRASDVYGRRRFTAFHEIVHTYLPGFAIVPQYRCDPALPDAQGPSRKPDVEELCDVGAVELLLPQDQFREDILGTRPTMDLASKLATRYEASLEATARRVVALHEDPAMFVVMERAPDPSAPREGPKLRVMSVHAKGDWPVVPKKKSVDQSSPLARPLSGHVISETGKLTGLTDAPLRGVYLNAVSAPYTDGSGHEHQRVLAMISPARQAGSDHAT
jgi:IrrE N-terminal-like domain